MISSFTGKNKFLSNFYLKDIYYLDKWWKATENAYHASKTFDPELQEKIRNATCEEAKELGSPKNLKVREDWNLVKDQVMFNVVRCKFMQNKDLAIMLIETGKEELIEGNTWNDTYWGVCNHVGKNKLGRILEEVRCELKMVLYQRPEKIISWEQAGGQLS